MQAVARVVLAVAMLLVLGPAFSAETDPDTEKGARIGRVVQGVITTALPGAKELVGLLWPGTKKEAKKEEIEAAAAEAHKKLLGAALGRLGPIERLSRELATLNVFLEKSVGAHHAIIRMLGRIPGRKEDMKPESWKTLGNDWKVAKVHLEGMASVTDAQIHSVSETWLEILLKRVKNANLEPAQNVAASLENEDPDQLRQQLSELSALFRDVVSATNSKFRDLEVDLAGLAEWAKSGATKGPQVKQPNAFKDLLETRYGR